MRTAVAAPPAEPFEDLFEVIDRMAVVELLNFTRRLRVMTGNLTDNEVREEFLRQVNTTDHPYSRTLEPCCDAAPERHLGYGEIPWSLPSVEEMRELIR